MLSEFRKILSLSLFSFFILSSLNAQEMKWGEIPEEDLKMKVYESYPDADAVVLGDDGLVSLDFSTGKYATLLTIHRRVKILKKSAFDRADISITYRIDGPNRLSKLSAQIISPSGEVVKIKKKQIFKEKVSKNVFSKKFAFPNVQEGSIIEYKYQLRQEGINELPTWYFQEDIPVRWSRYRVEIPQWFEYVTLVQGNNLEISDVQYQNGTVNFDGNRREATIVKREYALHNAPPLKEESYITTMLDYMTRIRFQLKGINPPNAPYRPILTSWDKLAKNLKEDDFGKQYLKAKGYKNIIKAVGDNVSPEPTQKASLEKIYAYVQKNMKWNNKYWYYPKDIEKAFEKRTGNSAEVNMVLLALLRNANITAYPALISTRRRGRPITTYPIIDQFNHLIVYAELDGKPMLLDAIHDSYAPGFLPINSLNKQAWLLKDEGFQWINIKPKKSAKSTQAVLNINEDGDIQGLIKCRRTNYQAFGLREKYLEKGEEVFIQEGIQKDFPDADINEYTVKNPEENKTSYQDQIDISIPGYAESTGEMMYIKPMLHEAYDENPFKIEKREYPVEMPYPFSEIFILNLTLPKGYAVESLPESASIAMEGKEASFSYNISQKGDKIQLVMKMNIASIFFSPEKYGSLKQFYDLIVEKQGEQIVLKKI